MLWLCHSMAWYFPLLPPPPRYLPTIVGRFCAIASCLTRHFNKTPLLSCISFFSSFDFYASHASHSVRNWHLRRLWRQIDAVLVEIAHTQFRCCANKMRSVSFVSIRRTSEELKTTRYGMSRWHMFVCIRGGIHLEFIDDRAACECSKDSSEFVSIDASARYFWVAFAFWFTRVDCARQFDTRTDTQYTAIASYMVFAAGFIQSQRARARIENQNWLFNR